MIAPFLRICALGLLGGFAAIPAGGGTLTGVVRNGTTGGVAAGQEVILIQLQGGMQPIATTKSDAQGRYHFDNAAIGAAPMLVRASYRGVNYHQNVPPGRDSADIEIFEPTTDAGTIQVASRMIVLQPNGTVLLVGEEYSVHNHSKPPAAYYKADGNFEFEIPEGSQLTQVSAWGPSGMPLVQGTIDRGKNRYAIAFPLRPAENGVRLSYQMPYPSNQATVRVSSPYAAQRVLVIAPPTLEVRGAGFEPAGTEQGWKLYAHDAMPAGNTFEISVSGTAPPPAATEAQETPAAAGGQKVSVLPGRLDDLKWILIAGFSAFFALGAAYLWRKPDHAAVAKVTRDVNRKVHRSLDELKENLFRLELRKQAGTISDQEYARERARAEKVLRDLVRG